MLNKLNHRIYALPTVLFIFLALLFVSAGVFIQNDERTARISKAQSVAEQVKISLEVFSSERIQALHNLMQNWPTFEPNQVDWFNAQALSLMGMQKGFSSLVFIDANGEIAWVTTPSTGIKTRIDNSLIGKPMEALGLNISRFSEGLQSTLLYSDTAEHHFIVVGRAISPQEPKHGFLVAGFDVQTILGVMLGELVGPQFNFQLQGDSEILFQSGELLNDGSIVRLEPFTFLERELFLSMQSQLSPYNAGLLIIMIGLLMSALVSFVLHKQLKGAVHLSVSHQRYLTASEASLDALLIYQPTDDDFSLVEANSYSRYLFRGACDALRFMSLAEQTRYLGMQDQFESVKNVAANGVPYEARIAVGSDKIMPEWIKIQAVKAGENIAITIRDVTERFRAQRDLKESEEKYRRLVDGMHRHFVYTKTVDHNFVYVSAGIEKILGFTSEDFCANESRYVRQVPDELFNIQQTIAHGEKPEPYVVWYQGRTGEPLAIEFSDTPINDEQGLLVAVEGIARDVTKELALQEEVYFQANHDQLTGLFNRYAFDEKLREILEDTQKQTKPKGGEKCLTSAGFEKVANIEIPRAYCQQSVMCFIDMDRFKLVNDSCGHPAGDKLLKEISTIFRQYVNGQDLLARIGGDEFCIIFRNQSLDEVTKRLDKLLLAISNYRFVYDDKLFFVGASIGVIEINETTQSAEALIKAADNACYKAKHLGRNRYFVFHDTDSQMAIDDSENHVLHALHHALQNDGFELYSQAIMPLNVSNEEMADHLQHYEILLRLNGQQGGLISPGLFIPLAERHGLMNKVDMWVVDNTLKTLESNPFHIDNVGKVAINLSGITLGDEMALHNIAKRMQSTSVPAEKICFEITETTAVTNLSAAKHFISTLRDLGCSFALDDFGAGMSSFTYLKNLDVDYVKIDGSFVRNIVHDPIDHATVTAINNIAHSMGKQTVAEFVVDNATAEVLRELKVDFGQGFALDKPKPLAHRVQWRVKLASA
ncbi:putative bifunctional diguanylate cyclase/phosphodiesterase [Alteromonas sp. PRIM-21]|uniref:putative bifunctional diguanylate cyclase/phosphodiesterase n=1 Tax=Alteromonas sp. PRIM-21 TaxID=1454978 RepID=UPI0022B965AF|nr:bifunctional diguanylate cyclase/phosphodiesterase [Alteromonas sp. PRIM-21]MCZ8530861.1 EAL domain-containing protein [Alteromonas sp. PRIM-21]